MVKNKIYLALICLFLAIYSGCTRKPQSTADIPRHLSPAIQVTVAPFMQPLEPGQLITGQIPEDQGRIPENELLLLDVDLRQTLAKTYRHYKYIPAKNLQGELNISHSTSQPNGFKRWLALGKKYDATYLLVPQVLNWHEREGSQAGVSKSAHCRVEFFLIDISNGALVNRSIFEEKQVGLADNLLGIANFFKRQGKWVSSRDLANEGMALAVQELGL